MLTNLNFLAIGERFPPPSEAKRLNMYRNNRRLFECDHADVYKEDLKRIQRVIGNFEDVISYPVILNFQKVMTLKIVDLLMGEEPEITAEKEPQKEVIKDIMRRSNLMNTAQLTAIDVSRYGDGLFYIRTEGSKGIVDVTQPPIWFPVVEPDNVRKIQFHVLAWTSGEENEKLTVKIHGKGSYEQREYQIDKGMIIRQLTSDVYQTGLDDFAIIQIPNIITSDRATGLDDYTDLDSIMGELIVRVGQVSRILDKHASPSMSGPSAALEQDPETGEWRLKTGNYFPRESKEDPGVEYITWEGHLEANFRMIEKLVNMLYTISEMGSAIFGDLSTSTGQVPSGSALRRLMISPLSKVSRIRTRFDPALKQAIALCSQLGTGVKLTPEEITINWQDGLPPDFTEDALIIEKRTAGKSTMSQKRALMMYDNMNEDQADNELAQIQDEESAMTPINIPGIAQGPLSAPEGDEE